MGDLTERPRELEQQRNSLDLQLVALAEGEIPLLPITDVRQMAGRHGGNLQTIRKNEIVLLVIHQPDCRE
ncbi:hypothetical protein [Nitrosospira briensis]|uniref:hypothetical protein n=1 Tax=Nitrosospira briensis TaxID=35799 RepID=UPI00094291CF|nr:hypothetical protein [Nitrosospira briensis]